MNPILLFILSQTVHYGLLGFECVVALNSWLWAAWMSYWSPQSTEMAPTSRYFLGDSTVGVNFASEVPTGTVYVEEWIRDGIKKCPIRYTGETIPRTWDSTPFEKHARTPWIWVGDRNTEIDLTRTFAKFLVVGNRIRPELVKALLRVTPNTKLIYIEAGTFKELDFPGEGLTIEEYDDKPLCSRGPVCHAEETVPPSVVDEHDDSDE